MIPFMNFQTEKLISDNNADVYKVAGFGDYSSTACVFVAGKIDGDFLRGTVFAIVNKNGTMESLLSTGHSYFYKKGEIELIGKVEIKES